MSQVPSNPRPELLAPAGGPEAAFAAFEYGADAVYLGLRRFSARADAENFDLEQVAEVLAWARRLSPPRRVYVTLNTLVFEDESAEVAEQLIALGELGVDAVIVQDLGVCRLARELVPGLELHASTQMAVHSTAGARRLRRLGIRRVIPARELTLTEVSAMAAAAPGLEVEVFVHGALCYVYSGLCLLSGCLRGRSGNRGECAYLCRAPYTCRVSGDRAGPGPPRRGSFLAMRDLAVPELLEEYARAGVRSFKIEGRKKTPLYVAAVTAYYRGLLDGRLDPRERKRLEHDIQTLFSRRWTSLYARGRPPIPAAPTDPESVGPRGATVGAVETVIRRGGEARLRFTLENRGLERFDGLRIERPGGLPPYGFSVERLFVGGRSVFAARPGQRVEVGLPPDCPRLPRGARIACTSSQELRRRFSWKRPRPGSCRVRRPVRFQLTLAPTGIRVDAKGPEGVQASITLPVELQPARTPQAVERAARDAFGRIRNTPYSAESVTVENPAGLFAPASLLNAARRAIVEQLDAEVARARRGRLESVRQRLLSAGRTEPRPERPEHWAIQGDAPGILRAFSSRDLERLDEFILNLGGIDSRELAAELGRLETRLGRDRIRLALPMLMPDAEEAFWRRRVRALIAAGWRRWQVSGLGALELLGEAPGLSLTADWPLYVRNHFAALELATLGIETFTVSPEETRANLENLLRTAHGERLVTVVYQDVFLGISATCAFASAWGACPGPSRCRAREMVLTSDSGDRILVRNRGCTTVLLADEPRRTSPREIAALRAAGAQRFRLDFLWRPYDSEQVLAVWRSVLGKRGTARRQQAVTAE